MQFLTAKSGIFSQLALQNFHRNVILCNRYYCKKCISVGHSLVEHSFSVVDCHVICSQCTWNHLMFFRAFVAGAISMGVSSLGIYRAFLQRNVPHIEYEEKKRAIKSGKAECLSYATLTFSFLFISSKPCTYFLMYSRFLLVSTGPTEFILPIYFTILTIAHSIGMAMPHLCMPLLLGNVDSGLFRLPLWCQLGKQRNYCGQKNMDEHIKRLP